MVWSYLKRTATLYLPMMKTLSLAALCQTIAVIHIAGRRVG
jgi:hypothetical protein